MKTHKWADIKARKLSAADQREVAEQTRALAKELHLSEVRRARGLTQAALADAMNTQQARIAEIERSADVYLSTLRRFIEAMGGELLLVARFRDGQEVPITLLDEPGAR